MAVIRAEGSVNPELVVGRTFGYGNGSRVLFNLAGGSPFQARIHPVLYKTNWEGGARTNYCLRSQTLQTTWAATAATIKLDCTVAPDGTLTADAITENGANTAHYILQQKSGMAGDRHTISCFAKAAGRGFLFLTEGFQVGSNATFDLVNGIISRAANGTGSPSASIVSVGNGWYRCSLSFTLVTTGTYNQQIRPSAVSSDAGSYQGTSIDSIYVWGVQDEIGSSYTAYIPTTSAAVTVYDVSPTQLYSTARTNLLLQSQDVSTTWTLQFCRAIGSGSTVNNAVAPDGTTTADTLIEDNSTNIHTCYQNLTVVSGTTYTASIYVKSAGRTKFYIRSAFTANVCQFEYDITAVTASLFSGAGSGTITGVGNGWYRLTITATATGSGSGYVSLYLRDAAGSASYTGDNTSGVILWGAQLETGSVATGYIPTTTTAVTVTDYSTDSAGKVTFASAPASGTALTYKDPWSTNAYRHFGVGDGTTTQFSLPFAPATPLIYRAGWAGNELLYATARTNLFTYSNTFNNAVWANPAPITITGTFGVAPDGSSTSWKLDSPGSAGASIREQNISLTAGNVTYSLHVKANTSSTISLGFFNNTTSDLAIYKFNISTLAVTMEYNTGSRYVSSSCVSLGNGWVRCALTVTVAGSHQCNFYIYPGSYSPGGQAINEVWGAQLETGSVATPYIPTTTGAVTVTDYALDTAGRGDVTFASAPADLAVLTWTGSLGPPR